MSKPLRQKAILELLERGPVASQEDLQRALGKRGFKVGQATLSRDIHDLHLVKTGTGYARPQDDTGSEPRLDAALLLSRSGDKDSSARDESGSLADVFPVLSGNGGYPLRTFSWDVLKQHGVELLFLATPHEVSRSLVPEAMSRGIRVIDLSGAWRLKQAQHRAVYAFEDADAVTAAELTEKAVYGLPELNGDRIANAMLVANPGCYATSVILALAPLLKAGVVDRERGIISDSKSGVSGAGKEPSSRTHFVSVADNLSAYSVFGHRHVGEILEQLNLDSRRLVS